MYQQAPQIKFMPKVDDILLIQKLGKGSFGEVYLSQNVNSNKIFATKKIDKKKVVGENKKYFDSEIKVLQNLNHPNIIKIYKVKETQNNYYIVMEYANGGSLNNCLKKYLSLYKKAFPEEIIQHLMKQIVMAVAYMHSCCVIHRDLKADNIMVHFDSENDKNNLNMMKATIKLIDFGFAIQLKNKDGVAYSLLGTPGYMAPQIIIPYNRNVQIIKKKMLDYYYTQEIVDKDKGYGFEVDIWSLGCICYELLTGRFPFDGGSLQSIIGKIDKGQYLVPKNASPEIISFIDKMLRYEGEMRLSANELLKEPFLNKLPKNFNDEVINLPHNFEKLNVIKDSMELYQEKMKQKKNYKKSDTSEISSGTLEISPVIEPNIPSEINYSLSGPIPVSIDPKNISFAPSTYINESNSQVYLPPTISEIPSTY